MVTKQAAGADVINMNGDREFSWALGEHGRHKD